jgi:uncharacterized membrane protein
MVQEDIDELRRQIEELKQQSTKAAAHKQTNVEKLAGMIIKIIGVILLLGIFMVGFVFFGWIWIAIWVILIVLAFCQYLFKSLPRNWDSWTGKK